MFLGYNTNGLAHHDLFDAVELLAEIGYRGVAITIDHNAPCRPRPSPLPAGSGLGAARDVLLGSERRACGRSSRPAPGFLLDPRREARADAAFRRAAGGAIDFYKYAIDCAAELGSDCVSLWSGVLRDPMLAQEQAVGSASRTACTKCSTMPPIGTSMIGFEPEPGMLIDSMQAFEELLHADRCAELASDARRGPSPVPGRDVNCRDDPPLGVAAGQRASSKTCGRAYTST